jgi:hypothetical protein
MRHRRYDVGATRAGWGSIPVVFSPLDGGSPVSHPSCDIPFTPRRTGIYRKGMISARPSCQGVKRSLWDPETFAPGGGMSNGASRL